MRKKGFTLIELMIAMSIFAIISVYLYQAYFTQIKQSLNFNNNVDIQQSANKALNMLTDEIRNYSGSNTTLTVSSKQVILNSTSKVIIDLNQDAPSTDINFNPSTKILTDKNGDQCQNIYSIQINQGTAVNENELIIISVTASKGNVQYTTSTAVNLKK